MQRIIKYAINFIFLYIIISCNSQNQNNKEDKKIEKRKIDTIFNELTRKYPNYKNNDIVKRELEKELEVKIDSILNLKENYIDDIPLKVFKTSKNPHGKGALVQFYTDNYVVDLHKPRPISDRVNFNLFGFMDENIAMTIDQGKAYFIYGKNLRMLNETQTSMIVRGITMPYYSSKIEITLDQSKIDYNLERLHDFNIGSIYCEVDSIKQAELPK